MTGRIKPDAVQAIEAILKRGNNAVVKRNKDGVVICEEIQKTIYRTAQRDERDRAIGAGKQ